MKTRIGPTLYGGRNGQVNDQMHDKIIKGLVQYDYSTKDLTLPRLVFYEQSYWISTFNI